MAAVKRRINGGRLASTVSYAAGLIGIDLCMNVLKVMVPRTLCSSPATWPTELHRRICSTSLVLRHTFLLRVFGFDWTILLGCLESGEFMNTNLYLKLCKN